MAVIGGRNAGDVLAEKGALEDVLQILAALEGSQNINDRKNHQYSWRLARHSSAQRLEDVAFFARLLARLVTHERHHQRVVVYVGLLEESAVCLYLLPKDS